MKKGIFFFILIHSFLVQLGQVSSTGRELLGNNHLQTTSSNFYPITMVDRQGSTIKRSVVEQATGTPYFKDEWSYATVITKTGVVKDSVKIKMHLQANEIHYQKDANTIVIIDTGIVKKVTLLNSIENIVFESGFPEIDKNTYHTFYRVLSSGKYTLLCFIEKVYKQSKNEYSNEQTNEFKEYLTYYAFSKGSIQKINPKKGIKGIGELIEEIDRNKMETFVVNQKGKSEKDWIAFFNYINENK
jgi:hypothetical protein